MTVNLKEYYKGDYHPKAGFFKRLLWYYANAIFLNSYWIPLSRLKVFLLRLFGAQIGKGVNIKPKVNIKYPWLLSVGNYSWIGEGVWIDNLVSVKIGAHCCLSQGSILLTGNHNYKSKQFDLMTGSITLEDGVWIGAKSMVGPGVTCYSHSVLAVQSMASQDLEAYTIYRGNPAVVVGKRGFEDRV